ncbi:putative chaperone protein DnaJ-like [Cocos nucifera]|uniref:Putative chaperone protein DnaJ-like n=1 Tax=Cocos nucifera TaxID=13894 RepID=A0A8K0N4I4_COCNU|nr:putative chaperone protein DnaJ-like [Cocos nucifera]
MNCRYNSMQQKTPFVLWFDKSFCSQDYYKVLEVDYDATDETIRMNHQKLALVSHLFKGMILTCNGLGINHMPFWTQQLMETETIDQ